jgi:hypothetical protein
MMKKDIITLEYRIVQLERQLDEVVNFLHDALKMRKQLDRGMNEDNIDRLLP